MRETLPVATNFIEEFINQDLIAGKNNGRVHTRFPPEPNGHPHIGHAKAIAISYSIAQKYGGPFNLRFDDTNPVKENDNFVKAIQEEIAWLGIDWNGGLFFGSDYFQQCYDYAVHIIKKGKAFVCALTQEEMRAYRGTLKQPGKNSPYRDRPIEENLDLFERMKAGEFGNGELTLRAKIDMASPNMNMRDPVMYRILHATHHHTGDAWCIYPMYDYAHPLQDAIEGITHSLCSLEYEDHRPLYDWFVNEIGFENPPRQIEFARLNLTNTIMSKRYLLRLVEEGYVSGWDDPRMPTLCGMRRRGYPPAAILDFLSRVGVAKSHNVVETALLEHCVREELGPKAPRVMAVLEPLRITLTNWEEGKIEYLPCEYHPEHPEYGSRDIPFGRHLFIEREDFMEDAPKKFFRLAPGREVRLKSAYIIACNEVIKDEDGNVIELLCTVDHGSKSGSEGANRKVKGTLHWVEETTALPIEARFYEPMLLDGQDIDMEDDIGDDMQEATDTIAKDDFAKTFNQNSLRTRQAFAEPALGDFTASSTFQFLRQGYFTRDDEKNEGKLVFHRTVSLKDSYKPDKT